MRAMRLCGLPIVLLSLALLACGSARRAPLDPEPAEPDKDKEAKKEEKQEKFLDLGDIHAEVTVLQVLHAFDLTKEQLKTLAELAGKIAQKPPPRKEIRASAKYRTALIDLRAALRGSKDDEISKAMEALDEARDKDGPAFDADELTDAARKAAPEVFAKLSSRQVVFYLSGLGDTFPDPIEQMLEGIAKARELEGKDWRKTRDDLAFQIASLLAGLDTAKEEKAREQVTALLDKVHDLTDKQYDEQKETLAKSARDLAGKLGPLDFIRHYVERDLAETLSNHRLAAAIEGRLAELEAKEP